MYIKNQSTVMARLSYDIQGLLKYEKYGTIFRFYKTSITYNGLMYLIYLTHRLKKLDVCLLPLVC